MTEQEYEYAVFADNGKGIVTRMLNNGVSKESIKHFFDEVSWAFLYHVRKRMVGRIRFSRLGQPDGPYNSGMLLDMSVDQLVNIIKENNI